MKYLKKSVAFLLVVCMLLSYVPMNVFAAGETSEVAAPETSGTDFYKVLHLDAGRKYWSQGIILDLLENMAQYGYNQLQIYFSDNQGFRLALDNMNISFDVNGETQTYDLSLALGNGICQDKIGAPGKCEPDDSNVFFRPSLEEDSESAHNYLTQADMDIIINKAKELGIEVVPALNMPGHMGAILDVFPRYKAKINGKESDSSIELNDDASRAFALAILQKYVNYFQSRGCKYFCVGGDEYGYDIGENVGSISGDPELYTNFVTFMDSAARVVVSAGMTPRAFNDYFYSGNLKTGTKLSDAYNQYEIYFWSGSEEGLRKIREQDANHKIINTSERCYYALGSGYYTHTAEAVSAFDPTVIMPNEGASFKLDDPAGAMFCIWCDNGYLASELPNGDAGAGVWAAAKGYAKTFAEKLETDVTITHTASGITVSAPKLTSLLCSNSGSVDTTDVLGAEKTISYTVYPKKDSQNYQGVATVSMPIPSGWGTNGLFAFYENNDGTITKISGDALKIENGVCTFNLSSFGTVGLGVNKSDYAPYHEFYINANGTYTSAECTLDGKLLAENTTYETDNKLATYTVQHNGDASDIPFVKDTRIASLAVGSSITCKISDGTNFLMADGSNTTDGANADDWTVTRVSDGYTIMNKNGQYIQQGYADLQFSSSTASFLWSTENGFYYMYQGYYVAKIGCHTGGWIIDVSAPLSAPYTQTVSEDTMSWTTTVTFTAGGTNGIDTVSIGGKLFSFQVIKGTDSDQPACDHVWSSTYTTDGTYHWKTCTKAGCTNIAEKAAHTGGTATCTTAAECATCHVSYGGVNLTNHVGETRVDGKTDTYTGTTVCVSCGNEISKGHALTTKTEGSISVKAWNHTSFTVTKVNTDYSASIEGANKTVAYDIVLDYQNDEVPTDTKATVTLPVTEDVETVIPFMVEDNGMVTILNANGVAVTNKTCTFEVPHFTVVGYGLNVTADEGDTETYDYTITVQANSSKKPDGTDAVIELDGQIGTAGTHNTAKNYATYTITHTSSGGDIASLEVGESVTCKIGDGTNNLTINGASDWTITKTTDGYTIQNADGKYIQRANNASISVSDTEAYWKWDGNKFYFENGNYVISIGYVWGGWFSTDSYHFNNKFAVPQGLTGGNSKTTITFTALGNAGEDTASIDNVTIKVIVEGTGSGEGGGEGGETDPITESITVQAGTSTKPDGTEAKIELDGEVGVEGTHNIPNGLGTYTIEHSAGVGGDIPEWKEGTTYNGGDKVIYKGKLYEAKWNDVTYAPDDLYNKHWNDLGDAPSGDPKTIITFTAADKNGTETITIATNVTITVTVTGAKYNCGNHTLAYDHDATHHWQYCTNTQDGEQCVYTTEKTAHSGGNATCLTTGTCSDCGQSYLNPDNHQFKSEFESDANGHWHVCANPEHSNVKSQVENHNMVGEATCVTPSKCSDCGYEGTDPNNHVWTNTEEEYVYGHDNTSHWYICQGCGEEGEHVAHTEGDLIQPGKDPTLDEDGYTATYECHDCGQQYGGDPITLENVIKAELQLPNIGFSDTKQYENVAPNVPASGNVVNADNAVIATYTTSVTPKYTYESVTTLEGERLIYSGNENGSHYLIANGTTISDGTAGPSALWTIAKNGDGYTIQSKDGYYLGRSATTLTLSAEETVWSYDETNGFYIFDGETYALTYHGGWVAIWGCGRMTTQVISGTTYDVKVDFTPVKVHEDTPINVQVGDYIYRVTVLEEDLSEIFATIEYWITCIRVTGSDEKNAYTVNATIAGVNSEEGVDVSTLVAAEGTSAEKAPVAFWKATLLNAGKHQAGPSQGGTPAHDNNDRTNSGFDFTKIRYYDYKWSVSDGNTWVDVQGTDQLVAYYLQKTNIALEINVRAKDWGHEVSKGIKASWESDKRGQVALSYGLVYTTGTINPTEANFWSKTTVVYDYWDENSILVDSNGVNKGSTATAARDIGYMEFHETEQYEVYKITITKGHAEDSAGNSIAYNGTSANASSVTNWPSGNGDWSGWAANVEYDKVAVKDDDGNEIAGKYWFDEVTIWDETIGGTPYLDALNLVHPDAIEVYTDDETGETSIRWESSGSAYLILLYIREKESDKSDQLTVKYVDDTSLNNEFGGVFNEYVINVEKGVDFTNGLNPGFTTTFKDGTTIENAVGVDEYIYTDLLKLNNLYGTKYVSGAYGFTRSELSEDGKTLILHYNKGKTKYIVVDFGLKVQITEDILDLQDGWHIQSISTPTPFNLNYGDLRGTIVDGKFTEMYYVPTSVILRPDFFNITVTVEKEGVTDDIEYGIYVVPATTVFYEEGFASYTGSWADVGSDVVHMNNGNAQQAENPTTTVKYNYGYDPVYGNQQAGASNGTEAVSTAVGDTAKFSFDGTGFELYANTTTTSGIAMVTVTKYVNGEKAGIVKAITVDTHMAEGDSAATAGQGVTAYNVPVVAVKDLAYGSYTVEIRHINKRNATSVGELKLDGFRVYNTMDTRADYIYNLDNEVTPKFQEVRDAIIGTVYVNTDKHMYANQITSNVWSQVYAQGENANIMGLILSNNSNTKQDDVSADVRVDYIVNGPKNEVYLRPGETLVLAMNSGLSNYQIGMKALNGKVMYQVNSAAHASGGNETHQDTNGKVFSVMTSSTDMYYPVSVASTGTITIANSGESNGILSITMIKGFGTASVFSEFDETSMNETLSRIGYSMEPGVKSGLMTDVDDEIRYYVNGEATFAGVVQDDAGNLYYINSSKTAVKDCTYRIASGKTNGLIEAGTYRIDENGKLVVSSDDITSTAKNGLTIDPDGEIRFYKDGVAVFAGLVQDDEGNYYYINSTLKAAKSCTYAIGEAKTNGLLPGGIYRFGADGKMEIPTE